MGAGNVVGAGNASKRNRNTRQKWHIRKAPIWHNQDDMPAMQRSTQEQKRHLPKRNI